MIAECITVGPFMANCFILGCEETKDAVIIDPGDEADRILRRVNDLGVNITKIINTHAHIDHVGAVQDVKDKLGVKFYLHKNEEFILQTYDYQCKLFGVRFGAQPEADGFLEEGNIIQVGKLEVRVILTPGHSPGGICFMTGDKIFVGDTLFAGSIGRTDLPGGSFDTLIKMIRTKLLILPAETEVLCGHGPETTIGQEKWTNPFLI